MWYRNVKTADQGVYIPYGPGGVNLLDMLYNFCNQSVETLASGEKTIDLVKLNSLIKNSYLANFISKVVLEPDGTGFYGTYNATGQKYAGLVRQAGSNFFLFKDLTTDPTSNTLATGSLTASNTATLRANITGGTVSSLASAIGVADGGTGATTLTAGGILIGSGTSAVTILANTGTAGTYGNATHYGVVSVAANGRVTSVSTFPVVDSSAIAFSIALG